MTNTIHPIMLFFPLFLYTRITPSCNSLVSLDVRCIAVGSQTISRELIYKVVRT